MKVILGSRIIAAVVDGLNLTLLKKKMRNIETDFQISN